jgi:hypothetical protein
MKFIKKNKGVILFYLELAIATLIVVKFAF